MSSHLFGKFILVLALIAGGLVPSVFAGDSDLFSDHLQKVRLGKAIFFDADLSKPAGQSCASCHDPQAGFADPDTYLPVSQGAIRSRFGNRNAQTVSYAMFSPPLHFDPTMRPGIMEGMYKGGLFWDGRADTLEDQAKQPFLNPLEMHNPSRKTVVLAVRQTAYAGFFEEVFGPLSPRNVDYAYECIAEALAAYMRSPEASPFTSKYDAWKAGNTGLSDQEFSGYQLFKGKALCFRCHAEPVFTNFGHQNLGMPRNPELPYYYLPPPLNPDGVNYVDRGLGDFLRSTGWISEEDAAKEDGKFKIPSLRNCAVTPPYVHNGVHETLHDVVRFNNTRDETWAGWPPPEVPENVHRHVPPMAGTFGRLGLTEGDINDIVAFLQTLTDGYFIPSVGNRYPVAAAGPDQDVETGNVVQSDGGGSHDPDDDAITYTWTFVTIPMKMRMEGMKMVPVVSQVAFSDPGAKDPTFVPDIAGIYDIALTVTDGELSDVDFMQVSVMRDSVMQVSVAGSP
ncbi:cytochrome-c peroxidase [Candidatus Deferrimicrobium sp.]|uniref:cytochrome-c peroxidase n=1 Tax=Candidatus Deferrimicrobium sp. TaxID=3060586 RepID=UPI002ED87D3C